jgi:hypothetical protein
LLNCCPAEVNNLPLLVQEVPFLELKYARPVDVTAMAFVPSRVASPYTVPWLVPGKEFSDQVPFADIDEVNTMVDAPTNRLPLLPIATE